MKLALTVALLFGALNADTQGVIAADQGDADFFLRGILTERQKLRSGVVRITGSQSPWVDGTKADDQETFEIYLAFDAERVYAENTQPAWVATQPATTPASVERVKQTRKYFRTKEKSSTWIVGNDSLYVGKPDAARLGDYLLFDVRALGLYNWGSLRRGTQLEDIVKAYMQQSDRIRVNRSDLSKVELVLSAPKRGGVVRDELELWLVPDDGFTVTRAEKRKLKRAGNGEGWDILEENTTRWKQSGEVWIPIHCKFATGQPNSRHEIVFDLKWQSINKPIDDNLFDWHAFGAPTAVDVFDSTSGETVLLSRASEKVTFNGQPVSWRVWFIVANIVVILCLCYLYWRGRTRSAG